MTDRYTAYGCGDGGVLLAPDCLLPSFHEQNNHGTLEFLCVVHCDEFPADVCAEIGRQVESKLYALLTLEQFSWRRGRDGAACWQRV
jgi:hypothetical protein